LLVKQKAPSPTGLGAETGDILYRRRCFSFSSHVTVSTHPLLSSLGIAAASLWWELRRQQAPALEGLPYQVTNLVRERAQFPLGKLTETTILLWL
jgi:hypothetical protein